MSSHSRRQRKIFRVIDRGADAVLDLEQGVVESVCRPRESDAIAGANNTSLAVVAPGIAEALFATAIGLFAAIPAVIAYNRLTHGLDRLEAKLSRFSDRFHATLSRELEVEVAAGH